MSIKITDLPNELFVVIMYFCAVEDVARLGATRRNIHAIIDNGVYSFEFIKRKIGFMMNKVDSLTDGFHVLSAKLIQAHEAEQTFRLEQDRRAVPDVWDKAAIDALLQENLRPPRYPVAEMREAWLRYIDARKAALAQQTQLQVAQAQLANAEAE